MRPKTKKCWIRCNIKEHRNKKSVIVQAVDAFGEKRKFTYLAKNVDEEHGLALITAKKDTHGIWAIFLCDEKYKPFKVNKEGLKKFKGDKNGKTIS